MTAQQKPSAGTASSGVRRIYGLRNKLLWSHLAIAAIGLSMLLVALWLFLWLRRDAQRLADVRGPTARNSAFALGGVHHSLASLRGWVLLGDHHFKVQREQAWRDEIRPSLETLQRLSAQWTDAADKQRLAEATSLLKQLDLTQDEIERIAQLPENEPARVLFDGHIAPTVVRIYAKVTGMIELEKEHPQRQPSQIHSGHHGGCSRHVYTQHDLFGGLLAIGGTRGRSRLSAVLRECSTKSP